MGRPVEVDVTANDKTGPGLSSVERRAKATNDRIKKDQDALNGKVAQGLVKMAGSVSPKLAASLTDAFTTTGARAAPILVGAVAAAAPLIGATLSAAVVGGAAGLGIVGGALLASRDARVQAAGKSLSTNLLKALQADSVVMVEPLLRQIDKVDDRFAALRPTIKKVFEGSADLLDPLTDGALSGLSKVIVGIERSVAKADPVVQAFGRSFDQIGGAVGGMFATLAEDADEGASAIDDLTDATVNFLRVTTGVIHGLSQIKGALDTADDKIDGFRRGLEDALSVGDRAGMQFDITADGLSRVEARAKAADGGMRRLGGGTFGASGAFQDGTQTAEAYAKALDDADDAARGAADANRSLYGATTDVAGAMAAARETLRDNGKTLALNSEKGRENRDALNSVAGALARQYEATVKANGVGLESARVAQKGRDSFVALAQKAGLSASAAQNLATKLGLIPTKRETKILADTKAAEERLRVLQGKINAIKGKTVTINVRYKGDGANENSPSIGGGGGRTFAAADYWRAVNGTGGMSRTGGPAKVEVESTTVVSLDGQPFREFTARQVRASERRTALRAKVGTR